MGCSPGITNVMTRAAVERLGGASSVKIRIGTKDFNPPAKTFCFPYSAQTIVEEFTLTPWIVEGGKFGEVKPRTAWELVKFPKPGRSGWYAPVTARSRHCR
jgi:saccharopine dehydrogenase-like NADP-dependent oxidoreductase